MLHLNTVDRIGERLVVQKENRPEWAIDKASIDLVGSILTLVSQNIR